MSNNKFNALLTYFYCLQLPNWFLFRTRITHSHLLQLAVGFGFGIWTKIYVKYGIRKHDTYHGVYDFKIESKLKQLFRVSGFHGRYYCIFAQFQWLLITKTRHYRFIITMNKFYDWTVFSVAIGLLRAFFEHFELKAIKYESGVLKS